MSRMGNLIIVIYKFGGRLQEKSGLMRLFDCTKKSPKSARAKLTRGDIFAKTRSLGSNRILHRLRFARQGIAIHVIKTFVRQKANAANFTVRAKY
jgi:hypothetical protein